MPPEGAGYGQPPKHTQFQKGKSGNPKGRPKESREIPAMLWRVLRKRIGISENGIAKRKQMLEIVIMQMVKQAATGDIRALQHLISLIRAFPEPSRAEPEYEKLSDEELHALIMGDLKKIKWPRRVR